VYRSLAVPDQYPALAKGVGERIDDLVVEERKELVARVDQIHLDPQVAKDRGVFAADHPGAARRIRHGEHVAQPARSTHRPTPTR
jgi:hypothetical protein